MPASHTSGNALSGYRHSAHIATEEREGDRVVFRVSPEYGSGQEIFVKVIDGMYVTYADCCMSQRTAANSNDYPGVICMYFMFDGETQINFKNNTACFIKKNDVVNFAGNAEFAGTSMRKSSVVAAGLVCNYSEVLSSLAELGLDTMALEEYYRDVSSLNDVLVYNCDLQFSETAKHLREAVLAKNQYFVKAKALEMLYCGITNYSHYKDTSKRKYNRHHLENVADVKALMEKNPERPYTITELARHCEISPSYFKRIFMDSFGIQPHRYLVKKRLEKAKEMLGQSNLNISDISEALGFSSSSRFSETFKKEYGYLPSTYRKEIKRGSDRDATPSIT